MSKPSVLLRAILVIAPFFVIFQLPNLISIYQNLEIKKTIESNSYVRIAKESRTRTITAEQQASDTRPSPAPENASKLSDSPPLPWRAIFLFPSLLALAYHYVASVIQWRGFNSVGKSALLLHFVGLGINVWPFIVNQRDWRDAIIPSLLALIICPLLALWAAITIESKGRPSETPQTSCPSTKQDPNHANAPAVQPAAFPLSLAANNTSQETKLRINWFPRPNSYKNGLPNWRYALCSAALYWLSYWTFTIHESNECWIFKPGHYGYKPVKRFIEGTVEGLCEAGHIGFLSAFFFLLATYALMRFILKRSRMSA